VLESAEEEEVEVAEEEEVEGAGLEDVEGAEDGPCRLCAIPGAGFAWPCFLMLQDEGWGWFCPPGVACCVVAGVGWGAGLEGAEGAEDGPCRLCAIPGAGFAWPCFLMLQDEGWGWFCPPGGAGRLDGCGGRFDEGGNRFGSGKPG
jgi:hypothetical protein